MRFLCNVHISLKVVKFLNARGYENLHVNDILDKSSTKDSAICKYADENDMIVITKDTDFKISYLLQNTPKKLVKINLGNISTWELITVISNKLKFIHSLNNKEDFLFELDKGSSSFLTFDL